MTAVVGCTALVLGVTGTGVAQSPGRDLGRQVLGAGDG
jgi:pectate lyase